MTNQFTAKTNFTAGELSPDLLGRVDLNSYAGGAQCLENVFIEPTGGVHRRPGLQYVQTLSGKGRLISYEQDSQNAFLFILQNSQTLVYKNDLLIATLTTPWTEAQIEQLNWCSVSDGLICVHPDVAPQRFSLNNNTWQVSAFQCLTLDGCCRQPYHRFENDNLTISSSGCEGSVTLTASAPLFLARHVGQTFKLADGYVSITSITDTTHANATVLKKLLDEDDAGPSTTLQPTRYWGEPAWSATRGWPACITTYQSRLVFGGSKSLPNTLWFSQSDDICNFEEGTALDNEAICFSLLSDGANKICALFAGRHLQVFTTSAEWMVSGSPLTPASIQVNRQTQVGSNDTRSIQPVGIDGATIFAAANGKEIREFLFSDLEGIYQATDLSLLAHHAIHNPVEMAYDKYLRQAYIVMQDGSLSVLTSFRAEDMQSWTRQQTDGKFISVALCQKQAYFIIQKDETYYLEKFNEDLHTDRGILQTDIAPKSTWENLNFLEGEEVQLVADSRVQFPQVVQNGQVVLDIECKQLEAGLPFEHKIQPLPPVIAAHNGSAPVASARLVKAIFRVVNTQSIEVDTGSGIHQELISNLSQYTLDTPNQKQTQDIVVRGLGWKRNPQTPLWTIQSQTPLPFQLVSVVSDIKIGE